MSAALATLIIEAATLKLNTFDTRVDPLAIIVPEFIDLAGCFKCFAGPAPHPWHDDGTPGPSAQHWESGGRYAARAT